MSDEERKRAAIELGREAEELRKSRVLRGALDAIERAATEDAVTAADADASYAAALQVQAVREVKQLINAYVGHGHAAGAQLQKDMAKERERRRAERSHSEYLTAARHARSEFDHMTTATREE